MLSLPMICTLWDPEVELDVVFDCWPFQSEAAWFFLGRNYTITEFAHRACRCRAK